MSGLDDVIISKAIVEKYFALHPNVQLDRVWWAYIGEVVNQSLPNQSK